MGRRLVLPRCSIHHANDERHGDALPAIRETWGPKCDGFMAASTVTEREVNAVNIPHEGEEAYENMWQKVRSVWSYVHDHYIDEYEWFYIGGDDLYVIVENLRHYLDSPEIATAGGGDNSAPLYLGRRFKRGGVEESGVFNSGGAGYVLNRAALKLLVGQLPTCHVHTRSFSEDALVAECLLKAGVVPYDTRDEKGRERFHPFSPGQHHDWVPPKKDPYADWYYGYTFDVKLGKECCAPESVSFHYITPELMRRMYVLNYEGFCPL